MRTANLSAIVFCLFFILHNNGTSVQWDGNFPHFQDATFSKANFCCFPPQNPFLAPRHLGRPCRFACGMSMLSSLLLAGKECRLQRSHRGMGLVGWMCHKKPCSQSAPCIFEAEVMGVGLLCVFWKWLL